MANQPKPPTHKVLRDERELPHYAGNMFSWFGRTGVSEARSLEDKGGVGGMAGLPYENTLDVGFYVAGKSGNKLFVIDREQTRTVPALKGYPTCTKPVRWTYVCVADPSITINVYCV